MHFSKRMTQLFAVGALVLTPWVTASACGGCGCSANNTPKVEKTAEKANVVETAIAAGQFKTLVAAVQAAGLADALVGEGPFTILAPTDEAFAKLPEGTVESLLKPENKDQLTNILLYHVIPLKADSKTVSSLTTAKTMNGQDIAIAAHDGHVHLNGEAHVTTADVMASNGIIHIIDTVLLPPAKTATAAE